MRDSSLKIPYFDTKADDEPYLQNYEALSVLQKEVDRIILICGASTISTSIATCLFTPSVVLSLASASGLVMSFEYALRVATLCDITKLLLYAYAKDGIIVTPRVKTDSSIIDLFVRMPDKRVFALALRGGAIPQSIIWREDMQQFRASKKGKLQKCGQLDKALADLSTTVDLKKNKHPIMGITSSERKVPIVKTIVLSGYSRISESNPSNVLTSFGNAERVLKIVTLSTTYVVEIKNLIDFLANPK